MHAWTVEYTLYTATEYCFNQSKYIYLTYRWIWQKKIEKYQQKSFDR